MKVKVTYCDVSSSRGERERLFGSREREGKLKSHSRFMGRERELENATGREGNGNFEARYPG